TKVSNSWIGGSKTASKAIGETSPKLLQQLCEPAPEKAAARKAQNNPGKGDYFRCRIDGCVKCTQSVFLWVNSPLARHPVVLDYWDGNVRSAKNRMPFFAPGQTF